MSEATPNLKALAARFDAAKQLMCEHRYFSFTSTIFRAFDRIERKLEGVVIVDHAAQLVAEGAAEEHGAWIVLNQRAYQRRTERWDHADTTFIPWHVGNIIALSLANRLSVRQDEGGASEMDGEPVDCLSTTRDNGDGYTAWISKRTGFIFCISAGGGWGYQSTRYTPLSEPLTITEPDQGAASEPTRSSDGGADATPGGDGGYHKPFKASRRD